MIAGLNKDEPYFIAFLLIIKETLSYMPEDTAHLPPHAYLSYI